MVKDRPILFSGEMVRAILDGRKTQTRRVIKPQPGYPGLARMVFENNPFAPSALKGTPAENLRIAPDESVWLHEDSCGNVVGIQGKCPYGQPGERLWVRETFADVNSEDGPALAYKADGDVRTWHEFSKVFGKDYGAGPSFNYDAYPGDYTMWHTDLFNGEPDPAWKPSIHMPRWASRITLEVTDVRVERLQDISEADAIAEGLKRLSKDDGRTYKHGLPDSDGLPGSCGGR